MELYPNHDKLPERVKGTVILTLVEGQCLLMLDDECVFELPKEPVIIKDKETYALKNIFKKKCVLFVDFHE